MLKHLHRAAQAARAHPGDWVLKPQAAARSHASSNRKNLEAIGTKQCVLQMIFQVSRHQSADVFGQVFRS